MVRTHLVTVLGREIPVRSSAQPEQVKKIEAFVNEQLELIRTRLTTADPQLVTTLALLNLAEAHLELLGKHDGLSDHTRRLVRLLERLDKTLEPPVSSGRLDIYPTH